MKNYKRQLKDIVRELRQKKNWNQSDLARQVKTSSATISRIESGAIGELKSNFATNLAEALGVTIDYLVGRTDKLQIGEFITLDDRAASILRSYNSLDGNNRARLEHYLNLLIMSQMYVQQESTSTLVAHEESETRTKAIDSSDKGAPVDVASVLNLRDEEENE